MTFTLCVGFHSLHLSLNFILMGSAIQPKCSCDKYAEFCWILLCAGNVWTTETEKVGKNARRRFKSCKDWNHLQDHTTKRINRLARNVAFGRVPLPWLSSKRDGMHRRKKRAHIGWSLGLCVTMPNSIIPFCWNIVWWRFRRDPWLKSCATAFDAFHLHEQI